ncbi:MAG TPA: hypothetical protein VHS78_17005 [Candidatus Elarobacter sp.]|jgi:hypothetical protein|nr:hypothetical protein [Candidatus Elarobacter sp.]
MDEVKAFIENVNRFNARFANRDDAARAILADPLVLKYGLSQLNDESISIMARTLGIDHHTLLSQRDAYRNAEIAMLAEVAARNIGTPYERPLPPLFTGDFSDPRIAAMAEAVDLLMEIAAQDQTLGEVTLSRLVYGRAKLRDALKAGAPLREEPGQE